MRKSQFTVSAESVQGNTGATVTYRALKVRDVREYRISSLSDGELLARHLVSWSGIVDDEGNELPSPADEPEILRELYLHEQQALAQLLFVGPGEESAKN